MHRAFTLIELMIVISILAIIAAIAIPNIIESKRQETPGPAPLPGNVTIERHLDVQFSGRCDAIVVLPTGERILVLIYNGQTSAVLLPPLPAPKVER